MSSVILKSPKKEEKLNLMIGIDAYLGLNHRTDNMDKALVLLGDEDIAYLIGLDRSARFRQKRKETIAQKSP